MILLILKTFLYLLFSLIYFYSVSGYGKLIDNIKTNIFEKFIIGNLVLLLIGYLIYLTIGTNFIINITIIFLGFIFFLFYKKEQDTAEFKNVLLLLILTFSVLIISKTHEDFNSYHYFSIYEIFNNNLRIGVTNLNTRFFHSSLLAINQSLVIIPYLNFKVVHLATFFLYFSTIGYFITILFSKNSNSSEVFYSLLCLVILIVKFNRLSEFGYDYIAQFILLIVFHKTYFLYYKNYELFKSIIFFILSICIKPITLFFCPFFIFIFYKKRFNSLLAFKKTHYLIIFFLLSTILSSSFFKTGCLFYPINSSCFSSEKIFWSNKEKMSNYSTEVSLWAKSYYAQNESKYKKILDKDIFKKNFNWFKFWIEKHFFYKVFEFILIVLFTIFIINIYFTRDIYTSYKKKTDLFFLLFLNLLSIQLWLNTVPQFRFGFSSILIFFFLMFEILFGSKIIFNKKKFYYLIFFSLIFLNIKNFSRIKNEFERNDFYKFKNFPFYNEKIIENDYSNFNVEKFYHIQIIK